MSVMAAWHVPARPPAEPLPSIQVRRQDGTIVAAVRVVTGPPGRRGWDRQVARLGYTRISRWGRVGLGTAAADVCKVIASPVMTASGRAHADLATGMLPSCPAATLFTADHTARLGTGHDFGARPGDVVACEIQAGHGGAHLGLGQPGADGRWWWLLWHAGDVRLVGLPALCSVEGRVAAHGRAMAPYPCILPAGHPPGHSWQLTGFLAA